jgi:Predicted membrane protein (DUF2232)
VIDMSLSPSEPIALPGRPFGRVVRSVIGYSLLTALMILTAMPVFVPAALLHCAIRNGRRVAWSALGIAVLLDALLVVLPASAATADMAWSLLAVVTLAIALPSMVALPMVERGEKFGRVLVFLLISSAIGLAVTELGSRQLLDFSPFAAQVAQAELTSKELLQMFRTAGAAPVALQRNEMLFRGFVYMLPAYILCLMALVFILSLLMLGRLKAWRELAARRADTEALGAYLFRNLRLPDWILFVFVLGGLTPLATGMLQKVAANTLAVVVFLYILQGLAIFRFLLVAMGVGAGGTMLGWFLLVFLVSFSGVGLLLLGVAGLFDPFFDFRHFKKRKDDSNESHSD